MVSAGVPLTSARLPTERWDEDVVEHPMIRLNSPRESSTPHVERMIERCIDAILM